jgi:micrococcal nuclease
MQPWNPQRTQQGQACSLRTFALALLLTLVVALPGASQSPAPGPCYTYAVVVHRVVDGDTLNLDLALGFDVWMQDQNIRLAHIDAPEMPTEAGQAAKAYLESLLGPLPAKLVMASLKDAQDKYGRYLGVFLTPSGLNINEAMVAAGHAVPYEGGKR